MGIKYIAEEDLLSSWQIVLLGILAGGAVGTLYLMLKSFSYYLCTSSLVVNKPLVQSLRITYIAVIAAIPWIVAIRYRSNIGFLHRFAIFGITYSLIVFGCTIVGVGFSHSIQYMLANFIPVGMILLTGLMWNVTVAWGVVWFFFDRIKVAAPGQCGGCGYDLSGLDTARCPECGRRFDHRGFYAVGDLSGANKE